ncbi:MAG: PD-(D/E)XK nuclease family protein, partial [Nitrospirota bacterium]
RFLASPHFGAIPEEVRRAVPAMALEAGGLTGKDSWLKAFESRDLGKEGRDIFRSLTSLNTPSNLESYTIFTNNLLNLLKKLGFTSGQEQDDYEDVLRGLCLLDSLPGLKPSSLRSVAEGLRAYLGSGAGENEKVPGVHVAPLRELRGLDPEVLYMGGLKDGDLPARPEVDFLLPDSVRTQLGLVDMSRNMRLQGYIFRRLAATAGGLRLSYPAMEGEKLFLPSLFLRGGEPLAESLYGDFSPEEAMTRRPGEPLSAGISELEGIKGRGKGDSAIRVTDIDAYRACPRRFFIEKVMGLDPPEIREYEVEPKTIGSVAHEVMERLVGPPLDGFEAFKQRAEEVLAEVLPKWPLDEYFRDLVRESFLTVLPDIYSLEEDLASEGYRPGMTEHPVRGEPLPGIKLKGKIDRVDTKDGGAAFVLDYKTGAAELSSASTVKRGAALQPFIYAAMLKAEGLSPESVGYYSLKDVRISRVPKNKDLKEGRTLDYFVESSLLYLDSTAYSMRTGDYGARPLSDATCRRCHERPYCPYIQGDAK